MVLDTNEIYVVLVMEAPLLPDASSIPLPFTPI